MRKYQWLFFPLFLIITAGCSSSDGSHKSGDNVTYLKLQTVTEASTVRAGYQLAVQIEVSVDGMLADVPVVVSGVKSDDQNSSVYFDTASLAQLKVGTNSYDINITVPRDVATGSYTLIVNVDPDDLYGDWKDEEQFHEGTNSVEVYDHGPDNVLLDEITEEDDTADSLSAPYKTPAATGASTITINATDSNISIDAFVALYPNLVDLNETDINVTACLDIGSECIALPLWSSEGNGTLSTVLELKDVVQGSSTVVSVDTILPYTEIYKIVNKIVDKLQNFQTPILDTALHVTLTYRGLQKEYDLDRDFILSEAMLSGLAPSAPASAPQASPGSCAPQVLGYSKVYRKSKYGKRFGTGVYAKGEASLDGEGIHSKVYSSVRVKAMGKNERFLKLNFEANALPGSFEDTGYDLDVEVLQIVVFTKSNSLASVSGLSTPEVTTQEEQAIQLKIDNNETNLSKAALVKQKIYKKAKNNISTYSGSGSTWVGYTKTWDFGKRKGYTQQFIVGIVPVKVTAGAQATVGFESDIALSGITSVSGHFKPIAKIGAYIQGGVGVVGYSAGVEADLWLVTETFKNTVTASLDMVEDSAQEYIVALDGNLHEKIYNYFKGPNGKLYLYAEYTVPKYCKSYGVRYICGAKTKTKRKYLSQFKTSTSKYKILDKEQTLFTIPLDDCN